MIFRTNRFKVGSYYKGINDDGTTFVFLIISKDTDDYDDKPFMTIKVCLDKDTTSQRYDCGNIATVKDNDRPSNCFTEAIEVSRDGELLALLL